jgi:hypothetical protein
LRRKENGFQGTTVLRGAELRSNLHAAINLIEQDHRGVKLRIGPMLGFRLVSSRPIRIARLIVPSRTITRTLGVDLKTPTGRLVLSDSAAWT